MDFSGLGANLAEVLLGAFLTIFAYVFTSMKTAMSKLSDDIAELELDVAKNYLQKEEFREWTKGVTDILNRIEAKIERKADK